MAAMSRIPLPFVLVLAAGCAGAGAPAHPPAVVSPGGAVLRSADLGRVRCVLVAPFQNGSDAPAVADVATAAIAGRVNPGRARVFPLAELRKIFDETGLERPQGVSPSLALELAEAAGADAALYGAVEGRSGDADPDLVVTVRLALPADRRLLFAGSAPVQPSPGEALDAAVKRTTIDLARPMLAHLGDPGPKGCFGPERAAALRRSALAEANAAPPSAAAANGTAATATPPTIPGAARATPAVIAVTAPAPPAAPHTPRQAEWARRLAAGERVVLADVAFAGRTATLQRDGGLADLAIAMGAAAEAKVRLEAFVDSSGDRKADQELSAAMARAAGERLVQLGVARGRVECSGRGDESPLLPSFTARGRAANRRVEVVGVR